MKDAGEKAMALVDGQLPPAEVPALVAELARNAPLVAELQAYLALSRSRLAAVYAAKSEEPVPAWLGDTVLRGRAAAEGPAAQSSRFGAGLIRWLQTGYRIPAWSLAAGPALAVMAVLALYLAMPAPPAPSQGRPMVLAESNLGPLLERTESGRDATVATLRPVLSFSSKADGWCRQVEVRNAARQVSHALACRGDDGQWTVVASTTPSSAGGGFAPAGAGGRKAIDDLATSMMRGNPLSSEEEAATIGWQWRTL